MAVALRQITTAEIYLEPEESIGQRVRMLRLARGWSLDKLAKETSRAGEDGLSRGTIWEMESSKTRVPWEETLQALSVALEVPVEYLRTGRMPANEQSLSEFPPEMYYRAKGIKRPDHLQLLSRQFEALQKLETLEPDDAEEVAPEE